MAHLKLDSSSSDSQFAILSTKKEERNKKESCVFDIIALRGAANYAKFKTERILHYSCLSVFGHSFIIAWNGRAKAMAKNG